MSRSDAVLPPALLPWIRGIRRRAAAIRIALLAPPVAVAIVIADRFANSAVAVALAVLLLAIVVVVTRHALQRYDARWLARRLNAALPTFEDSLELLFEPAGANVPQAGPGGLAALQRARLQARLPRATLPDLRPAYPGRWFAAVWGGAVLVFMLALQAPALWSALHLSGAHAPDAARPGALLAARVQVEPPAYTGLGTQLLQSLDVKVPEGSKLRFELRLAADPNRATLEFHDGSRLVLRHEQEVWRAERVIEAATLVRLRLDPAGLAGEDGLHRIDVIKDRPPEVKVLTPDRTLNVLERGQKTWSLGFEASDDYGLGPAVLSVALAQGSGENIKTTQQTLVLEGNGDARHRVYRKTLDLDALGFAEGDDLVVRLAVSDNRPEQPNQTESASFILRWPSAPTAASIGMEGLVQKTLPAYFASERQIIIDSEALQATRATLAAQRFEARSDELGVEQKVLRLRYGEFLGEESEASAQHDDDAPAAKAQGFGDGSNVTSQFGHVHDKPEAATLLDVETRRLLKAALGEMWQAELHLRQANPDLALPFEYKALEYIKQVQQAERIYLARAGVQLPEVDLGRRLSGDRTGLRDRDAAVPPVASDDAPLGAIWQALDRDTAPPWQALEDWVHRHQSTLPDALGLLAAADRLEHDPHCGVCRAQLRALLWPLLPQPATALRPRPQPDAAGAAYLQALGAPQLGSQSP